MRGHSEYDKVNWRVGATSGSGHLSRSQLASLIRSQRKNVKGLFKNQSATFRNNLVRNSFTKDNRIQSAVRKRESTHEILNKARAEIKRDGATRAKVAARVVKAKVKATRKVKELAPKVKAPVKVIKVKTQRATSPRAARGKSVPRSAPVHSGGFMKAKMNSRPASQQPVLTGARGGQYTLTTTNKRHYLGKLKAVANRGLSAIRNVFRGGR